MDKGKKKTKVRKSKTISESQGPLRPIVLFLSACRTDFHLLSVIQSLCHSDGHSGQIFKLTVIWSHGQLYILTKVTSVCYIKLFLLLSLIRNVC